MIRTGLIFLACCLAYSQTADKTLTFDVASVKAASPPVPDAQGRIMILGNSGGPGTKDPGRIRYPFTTLKTLIMTAYDVKSFQVSGPALLDSERFELTATMPPDTTKEQFRVMLQNLLADRFKLTIHRDSKELPIYSLAVGKNGPKMKESVVDPAPKDDSGPAAPPPFPSQPKIGPDGFPEVNFPGTGLFMMMMPGRARFTAKQQTMQDLASRLAAQLGRPVTDATALTAKYDFTLTFSPEGMDGPMGRLPLAPPPPAGGGGGDGGGGGGGRAAQVFIPEGEAPQDIFSAIQSQLGLKLESKKGPVELIVVDHAEKTPTEN